MLMLGNVTQFKKNIKTNMAQENFFPVLKLQVTDSVCICDDFSIHYFSSVIFITLYSFLLPHLAILLLTGVFMNLFDFM